MMGGHLRIKTTQLRDHANANYTQFICNELNALRKDVVKAPITNVIDPTKQAASMQKTLARDPKDDELNFNRLMPTKAEAGVETDAEKIRDELFAKTPGRFESSTLAENERRKSKNTLGDAISS